MRGISVLTGERHRSRGMASRQARIIQPLLALDACARRNRQPGSTAERHLTGYGHS